MLRLRRVRKPQRGGLHIAGQKVGFLGRQSSQVFEGKEFQGGSLGQEYGSCQRTSQRVKRSVDRGLTLRKPEIGQQGDIAESSALPLPVLFPLRVSLCVYGGEQ